MKKKIIALAVASTLALSACGQDDESELTADERVASYTGDDAHEHNGTDSHVTIDPVKEDPGIAATAVATSMFTWNPAQQVSVFHVSENVINEQLTGALAEQARDFDLNKRRVKHQMSGSNGQRTMFACKLLFRMWKLLTIVMKMRVRLLLMWNSFSSILKAIGLYIKRIESSFISLLRMASGKLI